MHEYRITFTFENCKFTKHVITLRGKSADSVKRVAEKELPLAYDGKPIVILSVVTKDSTGR